jgi:hypothetical protein
VKASCRAPYIRLDTLYSEEENEDEEMTKAEKNKKCSMNMNHSGALPPIGTVANIAGLWTETKMLLLPQEFHRAHL